MKRFAKLLTLTLVLAALLAVSAFAADFTHCADALHDMGLFQGTDQGYDLDRAPTRAEAAAMLVRLLGKDAEAQAMTEYTAPFTDVLDWAKPYVQYLYDNGLTTGKTATTFGSRDRCTAQQYATFLLRALGYADAEGDFTYANALEFAAEKGVVDAVDCNTANFLRDHVAAMSYTALSVAPKTGEADLLTKLAAEGAVQNAEKYQTLFADYRAFAAQGDDTSKFAAAMDMTLDMKLAGVDYLSGKIGMNLAADVNLAAMDQSKLAYDMQMDMALTDAAVQAMQIPAEQAKLNATAQYYYTDGALYMDAQGQKVKIPMSVEDVMNQMPAGYLQQTSNPISAISALRKTSAGGVDRYTMTLAPSTLNGLAELALGAAGSQIGVSGMTLGYDTVEFEYALRGNQLQSMKANLAMHAAMEGVSMTASVQMNMTDIKTGSAVTVEIPADLSGYQEASGAISGDGPTVQIPAV